MNEESPIQAKIEWLPPRNTYGLPILKYLLWYKPVDMSHYEYDEVDSNQNSYVLKNLRKFTKKIC